MKNPKTAFSENRLFHNFSPSQDSPPPIINQVHLLAQGQCFVLWHLPQRNCRRNKKHNTHASGTGSARERHKRTNANKGDKSDGLTTCVSSISNTETLDIHTDIYEEGYKSALPSLLAGIGDRLATQTSELTEKVCAACSYYPVIFTRQIKKPRNSMNYP